MCGRFAIKMKPETLQAEFGIETPVDIPPQFNVAPTRPILTISESRGQRIAFLARWGFIPAWVKDAKEFPLIINARAETLNEKPAFRGSLRHHRCIIPASGYYEWRRSPDGHKQPFYVHAPDDAPLAMAAIHSDWLGVDGSEVDTVAVITVPAKGAMASIHHRTPALISPQQMDDWLNIDEFDSHKAGAMLRPLEEGRVIFHPVSTRVNSARMDDEHLIDPVTEEAPPKPKPKPDSGQMDLFREQS